MICLTCFGFCFVGYAAEQVTCDRHDIHAVLLNVTLNTKTKSSKNWVDVHPVVNQKKQRVVSRVIHTYIYFTHCSERVIVVYLQLSHFLAISWPEQVNYQ
jgi:hypothetical protein